MHFQARFEPSANSQSAGVWTNRIAKTNCSVTIQGFEGMGYGL